MWGQDQSRHRLICLWWDHPHACGDKPCTDLKKASAKGSSPRVWGQVLDEVNELPLTGIIPTRVGTRTCCLCLYRYLQDHPHACGDKNSGILPSPSEQGSSPRVWGQGVACKAVITAVGIIPTRVGTSVSRLCWASAGKDHPHACGDKHCPKMRAEVARGSSPRVWGQVAGQLARVVSAGIIPTRVGTRVFTHTNFFACKDHPHACGDKQYRLLPTMRFLGSSPRVWGQAFFGSLFSALCGIIPTRVGTSCRHIVRVYAHRDHPHACGDKTLMPPPKSIT